MASNISKVPKNMLSNPNLDAADTGVDPSTGRYLTKKERIGIFRRRKIKVGNVFGRTSPNLAKVGKIGKPLAKFSAIVKTDDENIGGDATGGVEPKDKLISGLIKQVDNNSKKITLLKNIVKLNIQKVSKILVGNAEKEKKDQREDLRQQKRDDEKDKKKKKEGLLERVGKSVGKSLLKPVEAVGKSVKGILGRLGDAFMALFMGFVANKAIKMIQAHMSGDTETFKQMRNTIIKSIAVVGGIFLILNGGLLALPGIISGIISTVISLGGAMMAFMASPAGLIALGLAAGIGVLFALKKGVDAGRDYATGGAAFTEKHDALDQRLIDAGMTVKGEVLTGNAQQIRAGKGPKGKRNAEQEKIFQEVQEQRKVLNDTHTKMDAEVKQAQENAEPDSYTMKRVGKKRVRVPVVSQKRKDEIKKEIESKYYDRLRGVKTSPNIDSSPKNKDVKIDSNPKKNGVTTLDEPKTQIIDRTTTSGGGGGGTSGSGKASTGLPSISSSNRDNNHVVYSQTQYNIMGV